MFAISFFLLGMSHFFEILHHHLKAGKPEARLSFEPRNVNPSLFSSIYLEFIDFIFIIFAHFQSPFNSSIIISALCIKGVDRGFPNEEENFRKKRQVELSEVEFKSKAL